MQGYAILYHEISLPKKADYKQKAIAPIVVRENRHSPLNWYIKYEH